jgi:DnaA-homolog protein
MRQLPLGVTLRANAVFANFARGANAEILAALEGEGRDPVWLWGSRGCGKTHLLQAVCAAARGPAAYFPLSDRSVPPAALFGLASCRIICLDDAGAAAGDLAWERALFGLFNEALDAGSRLVFAASLPPRQLQWRLEDWRSRAAACVVYQLRELDEAGRAEALRLRAAQRGIALPPETLDYLMKRVPRDLPSLLALLDDLDVASLAAQRRLTIPFIRAALEKPADTEP